MPASEVRVPTPVRVLCVLLLPGLIALSVALAPSVDTGGAVVAGVIAVLGAGLAWRLSGASYSADDHQIVIRNFWLTHRVPISRIEGFDIGQATGSKVKTVRTVTHQGAIPIDVLIPTDLNRRRQQLADWLDEARSHEVMTGQSSEAG
jgi:hypothetical protein